MIWLFFSLVEIFVNACTYLKKLQIWTSKLNRKYKNTKHTENICALVCCHKNYCVHWFSAKLWHEYESFPTLKSHLVESRSSKAHWMVFPISMLMHWIGYGIGRDFLEQNLTWVRVNGEDFHTTPHSFSSGYRPFNSFLSKYYIFEI